jgi:hypothetical protein
MTPNTNSKWFFYGIPGNDEPVYGLYEPVHDIFFLIHTDLATIKKLVLLFSSRFTLHIVEVSAAMNYSKNLLDNTVCHQWSIDNKKGFPITRFPDADRIINPIRLVENNPEIPWNFEEEQLYLMAACKWIEEGIVPLMQLHAAHIERLKSTGDYEADLFIHTAPNVPFKEGYLNTIKMIESIIHLEFDLSKADQEISQLLDKYL